MTPFPQPEDEKWMSEALKAAENALASGDVPVGAIVVHETIEISRAWNRKEELNNPLAHAEILALEAASKTLGRWRLRGCTLYVTLEPCVMCAGALIHSRVDRVVYATPDPKAGAVHSLFKILSDARLNHRPDVHSGVLQMEASRLLKEFFRKLRPEFTGKFSK